MLTYNLPKELIAQTPCEPRDAARLLVIDRKSVPGTQQAIGTWYQHRIFRDLPEFLKAGDCLVLNDTKVLPARVYGRKAVTGGKIELLLLGRLRSLSRAERGISPEGPPRNDDKKCVVYRCLGQPAKNLKPGTRLQFDEGRLHAEVLSWENGERLVRFEGRGAEETLRRMGEMPLPPYIDRPVQPEDASWYQTVYAREAGAVAAPTAGLHFTPELLEQVRQRGVRIAFVTLHVGWGTFKPVGEKELAEGKLHPERFHIPEETARAISETKLKNGRVIAVGTTVVRALESAKEIASGAARPRNDVMGMTDLFIRPGFKFRVVDAMVTNFHLPGTSLLLMVSAFAGEERIQAAYEEAVNQKYRFYSYGDAMLIV